MRKFLLVISIITFTYFLLPKAWAQSNQVLDNGSSTTFVKFPVNGCVYNWTNDNINIGLPTSGTGDIPSFTAINTSTVPVIANITATPQAGCLPVSFTITVNPKLPAIIASGVLAPLSTVYGTASLSTSFNLSADNIKTGIVVTSPQGFEISADNVNFSKIIYISGELSNAKLNLIKLNPDVLRASAMGIGDYNYSATVDNSIGTMQITPIAVYANAVIKVNGIMVGSNTLTPVNLSVGVNIINIVVTAPDGITTKTYTITVNRAKSTDATLSNLILSDGVLSTVFSANVTNYIAKVNSAITSITLKPVTTYANATAKINGIAVNLASTSANIPLHTGANIIPIVITAEDGVITKIYTINVIKAESTNADITQFALSPASTLIQSSGTNNYTTSVSSTLSSVQQIATAADPNATIRVNGIVVPSGVASPSVALNAKGATTITTIVTSQDGSVNKTYTIAISKNGSTDASLVQWDITPASTIIYKSTTGDINNYAISVDPSVTSIQQTAVTANPKGTIKVNGVVVASGTASLPILLNNSGTTLITTTITAEDGITISTRLITVSKNGSSNASFSQLILTPYSKLTIANANTSTLTNYTTSVSPSVSSVQQTVVVNDTRATIRVNGIALASGVASAPIALNSVGTTTITTIITAADGVSTHTYTLTISKNGSANANLAQLSLTSGSTLTVIPGSTNYTTSVSPSVTSVQQIAVSSDAGATIRINGNIVASGATSAPIPLNSVGTTTIKTIVTAQDGVSTQTYSIVVSKNGSTNAAVSSFGLSQASILTQIPGINNYITSVIKTLANIQLTTVSSDSKATIKVNGVSVLSGVPSGPIALNSKEATTITAIITAQDGVSTKTYNITINKNGSSNAVLAQLFLTPQSTLTFTAVPGTTDYNTSVIPAANSVQQTAVTGDAGATIKVNGVVVASGVASSPIPLDNSGTTTITTVVTAQDGVTTKTYTITINRGSNNEVLAPLPVSSVSTPVYVILAATTPANSYTGNVVLTNTDAATVNVPTALSTVNKAPLNIMLDNINKVYGTMLTGSAGITKFTATGLKNAETISSIAVDYGNGALANAPVAIYKGSVKSSAAVGANGFLNSNYNIDYAEKDIMVTPAPLTIGTKNISKNYGTTLVDVPNSTNYTITGGTLQNGNTINSVNIAYGQGAAATAAGGTYAGSVILSGAGGANGFDSNNYKINYANADIAVSPVMLTITANNQVKDFGKDNPVFTLKYSGFVNNDGPAQLTSQAVVFTPAITRSPIGQYLINVSNASSPNYFFKYVPGVLTVSAEHVVLVVPNVITPNGDGINDTWNIKNLDAYPNATVDVFDRYGHKLFSSIGYGVSWDGTYHGAMLPAGPYYYIINPKLNARVLNGNVNIVR